MVVPTMNRRCYELTDAEKALLRAIVDEAVDTACAQRCSDPLAFLFGFVASAAGIDDPSEHIARLLASRPA